MNINGVSGGSYQNATSGYSRHCHSHIEQCFLLLVPYVICGWTSTYRLLEEMATSLTG